MNQSKPCVFCTLNPGRIIAANGAAFVTRDGYPISMAHTLIIPRGHFGCNRSALLLT